MASQEAPFNLLDFIAIDMLGCALPRKRTKQPPSEVSMQSRHWGPAQPDAPPADEELRPHSG